MFSTINSICDLEAFIVTEKFFELLSTLFDKTANENKNNTQITELYKSIDELKIKLSPDTCNELVQLNAKLKDLEQSGNKDEIKNIVKQIIETRRKLPFKEYHAAFKKLHECIEKYKNNNNT